MWQYLRVCACFVGNEFTFVVCCLLVGWFVGRSVGWLLVGLLVGWLVGWLVGIGWSWEVRQKSTRKESANFFGNGLWQKTRLVNSQQRQQFCKNIIMGPSAMVVR